ncbi:MAG TPA: ABC transporter permease subunit [Blastocatellia bacterium]|jgi:ABC-type transport system involved in multi-copper enzyme maturation permease subunit
MKIIPIALNTFRESARDRALYNLALLAVLMIVAAVVMGRIAAGQETKIIIDLGLSSITVFGVLIAILLGIGLVSKEIENGAIANILSKPVRRSEFVLGKYFGLCLTLFASVAAPAAAIAIALIYAQGGVAASQLRLWPAVWMIFLELAIVTAVALLFSCFSSPALSAMFALLIFLIGRWSPDLKLIAETSSSAVARAVSRALYHLLPNLANFNYVNETARGESAPWRMVAGNTAYAVFYIAAMLAAAALIFNRRDFK